MTDFDNGLIIGAGIAIVVFIAVVEAFGLHPKQAAYEEMHNGFVKCIDTPDKQVYCYEVKQQKVGYVQRNP